MISQITYQDRELFCEIYKESFPLKKISLEKIDVILSEKYSEVWGYFDKDVLVGFLYFWIMTDSIEIMDIGVDEAYRSQGVATKLMNELIKKQKKIEKTVFLEVRQDNIPAISLYAKLGFECYGERESYYPDGMKALLFRKI